MSDHKSDFDPRTEADAHIAHCLEIVVSASECIDDDGAEQERRDYTPEELDRLLFSLGMATAQIKKLPGGAEAIERHYTALKNELRRRRETSP